MMPGETYEGPVCYVGHDHEAADGRALAGGNHYTVVPDPSGDWEMPGERLALGEDGAYRFADDGDASYRDSHPGELKIAAVMGNVGNPQSEEDYAATYKFLDDLEARLEAEGVHEQEQDHILRSVAEVQVVRGWLQQEQERRAQ